MKSYKEQAETERVSFMQLFRVFFVLFSLYLLQNVFFRWDGFSYYGTFLEYVPAVALVSILWTITAFVTTIFVWILSISFEWLFGRAGLRIRTEHLLFYGAVFILNGALVWKTKRLLWPEIRTSIELKFVVLISVVLVSIYFVWVFRNRLEHWFIILQERITPLIWLFGIIVMISVPVVGYYSLEKESEKPIPKQFAQTAVSNPDKEKPNILLVTFDTLTARDMSLYGFHRDTTPFIDKWAKGAAVFSRAQAVNNHTTPTTATLMTGKMVWTHQVYHQSGSIPLKSDIESLPKVLKENGYYNVVFNVNPSSSAKTLGIFDSFDISPLMTEFYRTDGREFFDLYHGDILVFLYRAFGDKIKQFDWILDTRLLGSLEPLIMPKYKLMNPLLNKTAVPPEIAFNKFLEIYDDLPEPYFVWLHLFPPHALYLPPEPYRGMFGPDMPPERYKEPEGDDTQFILDMRMLYDEFIRYCDSQFEDFIKKLETGDKMKDTVIILSSDHGESFQHGVYQHAVHALYEQLTHVPLVIKDAGQSKGTVIDALVSQVDIPPTILELAHIPVPDWMEGRSLVPYMRGEELPPLPVFSVYLQGNRSRGHEITKGLVAVWENEYKLIYDLEIKRTLLFNLERDPEEMKNLIETEPEIGTHLLDLINKNLAKANEKIRMNNEAGLTN